MRAFIKAFIAGILAILVFNQGALWVLDRAAVADTSSWDTRILFGTGVPAVAWIALWGALWGLVIWFLVRRTEAAGYYVSAVILSAVLLTGALLLAAPQPDVAAFGISLADRDPHAIAMMLIANAAYGLGFAILMRLFHPPR